MPFVVVGGGELLVFVDARITCHVLPFGPDTPSPFAAPRLLLSTEYLYSG
jgi:hypothetical protein